MGAEGEPEEFWRADSAPEMELPDLQRQHSVGNESEQVRRRKSMKDQMCKECK